MNKRYLILLASLMCMAGCDDSSSKSETRDCNCTEGQTCIEGICHDQNCNPPCGDAQICIDNECRNQDCNPACAANQICVNNECKAKTSCDPECKDNQECVAGECRDKEIQTDTCDPACKDNQECVNGECKDKESPVKTCDPACEDNQECVDGECKDKENPVKTCDPACEDNQECIDGECRDITPKECDPACTETQECIDGECRDITPKECDPACTENQLCVDGTCQDKAPDAVCNPACEEGQTCIDNRCAICIGDQCFFPGGEETSGCKNDTECAEGQHCQDGECKADEEKACDPACTDGLKCVQGECKADSMLFELCNNQVDCASGECIYYVSPSKEMTMDVNGEKVVFNSDNPISVSLIDSRINADNYNLSHPNSQVSGDTSIGICTYECTRNESKKCPTGWSCQIIAKGDTPYSSGELPFIVDSADMEQSGFAAVCRPDVTPSATMPYSPELCTADADKCAAAGMIYYNDMCLQPCEEEGVVCPLMFSCKDIEVSGSARKACLPVAETCSSCYDNDGDGLGYGHCKTSGVDCDDHNANAYYGRKLTCEDIVDNDGNAINADLNCNGIIDRFELVGNLDNCGSCGNSCKKPKTQAMTVTCEPKDSTLDSNWSQMAGADYETPEFQCIEQCAFGYGDCDGNAKCATELLTATGRTQANGEAPIQLRGTDVNEGSAAATIYALDADGDGFPVIDYAASRNPNARKGEEADSDGKTSPRVVLDSANTLICCSNNTDYCYTANGDWTTTKLSERQGTFTNEDGSETTIEYASPTNKNSKCTANTPYCYDSDDTDAGINPNAEEKCDGLDNDGSKILIGEGAQSCAEWCENQENDCTSFTTTENGKTIYRTNASCDATPDGSLDTAKVVDKIGNKESGYGEQCTNYNTSGDICSDKGIVVCKDKSLVCETPANAAHDGLNGNTIDFNGKDDNCNGTVDEEGWLPCVIKENGEYSELANGIPIEFADYYTDATASKYKLPLNKDGSINLCRIGVLKGVKNAESGKVEAMCFPLYKPRAYDFYGDSVDSNCDGVDYDIDHTVFMSANATSNSNTDPDSGNDCKFSKSGKQASPCLTFNSAMKKAKDSSRQFYHDILVTESTSSSTTEFDYNADKLRATGYSSPLLVQTLSNESLDKNMAAYSTPSASKLKDQTGHIKGGNFISAYAVHKYLADSRNSSSSFDVNSYLFTYMKADCTTNLGKEDCTYSTAPNTEKNQPEEVIRIYGGFKRVSNAKPVLPSEGDVWSVNGTTKINWTVTPSSSTKLYSMVTPNTTSSLSLRMHNIKMTMKASSASRLPSSLADGATFVGINGSRGTRHLILKDCTISVTAPDGYSYPSNVTDTGYYAATGYSHYAGSDAYRKENDKEATLSSYITYTYNEGTPDRYLCGYGRVSESAKLSYGGAGGYSKSKNDNDKDPDWYKYSAGRSANNSVTSGGKELNTGGYGGSQMSSNKKEQKGCDSNCLSEESGSKGSNGKGGANGANGSVFDISRSFAWSSTTLTNYSGLYVRGNRSSAKGSYGIPGAGGGGGAVFRCWKGGGSKHTHCIGPQGGSGGCGGEGGAAGGIGGSALGIVVASSSTTEGSVKFELLREKSSDIVVTTINGSGGKGQAGGIGGSGTAGGKSLSYARENSSTDVQCQGISRAGAGGGGGAGGAGAGGVAGYNYPIVMVCSASSKPSAFTSSNNYASCGFAVNKELIANPTSFGDQKLEGQYISGSPTGGSGGSAGEYASNYSATTCNQCDPKKYTCSSACDSDGEPNGRCEQSGESKGGSGGTPATPSTSTSTDYSCKSPGKLNDSSGSHIIIRTLNM